MGKQQNRVVRNISPDKGLLNGDSAFNAFLSGQRTGQVIASTQGMLDKLDYAHGYILELGTCGPLKTLRPIDAMREFGIGIVRTKMIQGGTSPATVDALIDLFKQGDSIN